MASLDKNYYRAANKRLFKHGVWEVENETPADGILHGDIEARSWTSTKIVGGKRIPKVNTRQDWSIIDGHLDEGSGTSLHDHEGALGYRSWSYFELPEGTPIPPNLIVIQRGNKGHYQIEVRTGGVMTPDALRGALDNFARSCVVRMKELAEAGK